MQLDLTHIRKAEDHFERVFQPEAIPQEGEAYRVVAPAQLAFDIRKDKAAFRLTGTLRTELELGCSRCLEPFILPVDVTFDQRYLPQSDPAADHETENEVEEDDLDFSYYRDDQIDLDELMREQFYLVLPMKPLCREDCRGLCPQCGANKNTAPCDCAPVWEDPRLAPLKNLKKILKGSGGTRTGTRTRTPEP